MTVQDELETELKEFIVVTLGLEDLVAADISSDEALFGEGLGLDSIDALELGVALQKKYGVKIDVNSPNVRANFATVKSLAAFVAGQREQ